MSAIRFIDHQEKQILLMDFSNAGTTAEIIRTVEEIKRIVEIHQAQSILALVDFTGMKIDKERTMIIKDMAAHNRPYIKFIALVGLGFIRSVAFRMMLFLSGRKNHRVFGNRDMALGWLAGRCQ